MQHSRHDGELRGGGQHPPRRVPARTTSETAACVREETEAYVRAELPSESPDRTSKRVNDHDAVDGSRLSSQPVKEFRECKFVIAV